MGRRLIDIARTFLFLGLTSFGGPAVHIARFEQTFVRKLGWLSAQQYQMLVAQAHFLPGPASSQVGFAIGYQRAGLTGAVVAFLAFTLPSVLLMLLAALQLAWFASSEWLTVMMSALKLLAVVVVSDAVWTMAGNFCRDGYSRGVMLLATWLVLLVGVSSWWIIALGAASGFALALRQTPESPNHSVSPDSHPGVLLKQSLAWLAVWAGLLLLSFLFPASILSGFYQAGSFVFGGGHVVLPLLAQTLADHLDNETLLRGYAAAQMVPGPMFTIATWLGAELQTETPVTGALLATVAVFLPGFLLMLAFLPWWHWLSGKPVAAKAIAGVNAAVVGLLLATLLGPVATGAIHSVTDVVLVVAALWLSMRLKWRVFGVMVVMLSAKMLLFWSGI